MVRFRLFGIPVAVRPAFFLIAVLLGLSTASVSLMLAWVGIVFVSILIHELGHAFTARAFGAGVAIELNGLGGLTSWGIEEGSLSPGRRAAVAASGSAVGVVFGGLVWLLGSASGPHHGIAGFVLTNLVYVNLFWGLLNWLPIRPLDGGHLLSSLLEKVAPRQAERVANVVFMITAVAGVIAAVYFHLTFAALLAGWLLLGEFTRGRPRQTPVPIPDMDFDAPVGVEEEPEGNE